MADTQVSGMNEEKMEVDALGETTASSVTSVGPYISRLELPPKEDGTAVHHSLLCLPPDMVNPTVNDSRLSSTAVYNIAMFDVSGSMCSVWPHVMEGWNNCVATQLSDNTDIYTFGSDVKHRRTGTTLCNEDNDRSMTNFTEALKVINERVQTTTYNKIRIFLITDGDHNCSSASPSTEIEKMTIPTGKTIEVYLLGVSQSFPVEYSVDIRSRFHNGSASCPTIFWCKETGATDVINEMTHMQEEIKKGSFSVNVSIPAKVVPLIDEEKTTCSPGEFLYYEMDPIELQRRLVIKTDDDVEVGIDSRISVAHADFLAHNLFKQWNSVLIQMHRKKLPVPKGVFDIMHQLFDVQIAKISDSGKDLSVKDRLLKKEVKTLRTEFSTQMNQSRSLILLESEYKNEIELAEAILKTTVQSRYDTKLLKIRGHHSSDWDDDIAKFSKKYEESKNAILALPSPVPEDCCRILMTSFLSDLKDRDFGDMLKLNKMEFLTNMTFTGIPIYAPVKDSAQINPWTLFIKNICVSPFEILSQTAMESSFAVGVTNNTSSDKEITLQVDNPGSVFNAIIPIIPKEHCTALKQLVRTSVFAAGATFCILKNALIIDYECHFAALGCAWMKTIKDFPKVSRPDYIKKRITNIEETAKLYLDRKSYSSYSSALLNQSELAFMTEANAEYEGLTLKCESIVKPAFLIHLIRHKIALEKSKVKFEDLLQRILMEFIGRCISSYTSNTTFMDFFTPGDTKESRSTWVTDASQQILATQNVDGATLLKKFFTPNEVRKHTRETFTSQLADPDYGNEFLAETAIPNMDKMKKLRNFGSAGSVFWSDLRAWAEEFKGGSAVDGATVGLISQEELDHCFSDQMITTYLLHAIQNRQSKERMKNKPVSSDEAIKLASKTLRTEQLKFLKSNMLSMLEKASEKKWRDAYMITHAIVAVPLSKKEIIEQASKLGVSVTKETFDKVYKYRPTVGLCRNCCHVAKCPHFLIPNRRFNCHLEVERDEPNFLHTLHMVSSQYAKKPAEAIQHVKHGTKTGTMNRRKPSKVKLTDALNKKLEDSVVELQKRYKTLESIRK